MGDRGNIKMVFEGGSNVYFYSHWGGSELPQILQSALTRGKGRWNDEPYLARIIFCEMIQDDVLNTTGYGISPYMGDNEHPILTVNCHYEKIWLEDEGGKKVSQDWTFEEFLKQNIQDF